MKVRVKMKSPSLKSGQPANQQGGKMADHQSGQMANQQSAQPANQQGGKMANRQGGNQPNRQGGQLAGSCRGRASVRNPIVRNPIIRNPIIRNPTAAIILQRTLSLNYDCGGRGATRPTEGAARDWEAQQ